MAFSSVGVVGSGPVACAVAIAIARTETPVLLLRSTRGSREATQSRIERRVRFFVDTDAMTEVEAAHARACISLEDDLAALESCDLVLESVSGDLRARRAVLATLEGRLSPAAVLASNTGPDELPAMAEVLRRRDQFVGLHFFHAHTASPAGTQRASLPSAHLVEVGLLDETAPGVVAASKAFVRSLGTSTIERTARSVPVEYREFLSDAV